MEMLKKGGILQVSDPSAVHVVQVTAPGEQLTQRWRVYVPKGRKVQLNARLELRPDDQPPTPRLPPNAIVVAERATSKPINLGPGENVVSLNLDPSQSYYYRSKALVINVVGDGGRQTHHLQAQQELKRLLLFTRSTDITDVEHAKVIAQELRDGRTVTLADGKTFVLCRFRDRMAALESTPAGRGDATPSIRREAMEVLVWLHPDEG